MPPEQSGEDVWDLSDFEAVDESQLGPPAETDTTEEADALWNEAAAEAIDLVETTNLEADNEPADETPPAEDHPESLPEVDVSGAAQESAPGAGVAAGDAGFGLVEGESAFEALDLGSERHGAPLEVNAPTQRPPDPAPVSPEPLLVDLPLVEDVPSDPLEESPLEEVSVEPLPEFGSEELPPELPSAVTEAF